MQLLNLRNTLNEFTKKINDLLSPYTSEPAFWVILAIVLLLICCWAIRYFGEKWVIKLTSLALERSIYGKVKNRKKLSNS